MEIFVFAILAGYLFFRLWSVLGTRTGHEKPRFNHPILQETAREDGNLVIVPRQTQEKTEEQQELEEKIVQLQAVEPSFKAEMFIKSAVLVFERTITSFAKGDLALLKRFLSGDVYQKFETAVLDRREKNLVREAEISNIEAEVLDIEIDNEQHVSIKVKFRSQQMLATIDENGNSFDNPAKLKVPMIDEWTFTKTIASSDPTWYLCATYSQQA